MQDILGLSDTIVPEETDHFLAHFRHACVTHLMNIRLLATICFFFCALFILIISVKSCWISLITYEYSFENWFCLCHRSPLILQGYWTWSDRKSSFAAEEIAPVLQCIFQKSLDTGELPLDWRKANITTLFKKGATTDPANYRPVSLTCTCCKLWNMSSTVIWWDICQATISLLTTIMLSGNTYHVSHNWFSLQMILLKILTTRKLHTWRAGLFKRDFWWNLTTMGFAQIRRDGSLDFWLNVFSVSALMDNVLTGHPY